MTKLILASILTIVMIVPLFAANGLVVITQADVNKGGIPGTNGASGFPVTIVKPGSYQLGSDLVVPPYTDGVDINISDVTLDLNGFTIRGPVTCKGQGSTLNCGSGAGYGVTASSNRPNITVKNGNVRGFGSAGVNLGGPGAIVEEIQASENSNSGIQVSYGLVSNCTANRNGSGQGNGFGFFVFHALVRNSQASQNAGEGFYALFGSIIQSVSTDNGDYGFAGYIGFIDGSYTFGNYSGEIYDSGQFLSSGNNSCTGYKC